MGPAVQASDSAAAAYFAAVWATCSRLTFEDDLPEGYGPTGGSRWLEVVRRLLEEPDVAVVGRPARTVGVVEGRDEVLTRALVAARRQLTAQLGSDAVRLAVGPAAHRGPRAPGARR